MKSFFSMGALFVMGTFILLGQPEKQLGQAEKQWEPFILMSGSGPALKEAGFDLNDPESLILAARHEDSVDSPLIRQGAAYGLRMFPPSPRLIGELMRLVDDPNGSVAIMACQSLAKWNDRSWMDRARARLGSFGNGHNQVAMSRVLAEMGDHTGWPLIKENLTRQYYATAALVATRFFVGMKDSEGKEVDIAREVELMAPHIEAGAQHFIGAALLNIREEQQRKKEGRPPPPDTFTRF